MTKITSDILGSQASPVTVATGQTSLTVAPSELASAGVTLTGCIGAAVQINAVHTTRRWLILDTLVPP
jgi:hypothetical protein